MTSSNDLWVIDFDFQSIDQLVEILDPDYYQAVSMPGKGVVPVTLICKEREDLLVAYKHVQPTNEWFKAQIGHTDYALLGQSCPDRSCSIDDYRPEYRSFKTEDEVISFFERSGHREDPDWGSYYWDQFQSPYCLLPEFWDFYKAQICNNRPYYEPSTYWYQSILTPMRMFWYMLCSPFERDEWGVRPITTLDWWFSWYRPIRSVRRGPYFLRDESPMKTLAEYVYSFSNRYSSLDADWRTNDPLIVANNPDRDIPF